MLGFASVLVYLLEFILVVVMRNHLKLETFIQDLKLKLDCRILIAELSPADLGPKRAATLGSGLAIINTEPWDDN